MAQLNVRGKVLYLPGPWGLTRPAPGVSITLEDQDVGNANDTIWTGRTNAQGEFSGTTADWRDSKTVTVSTPLGSSSTTVGDLSDVMALRITLTQRIGNRLQSITLPFVPAPPGLPQPPLLLSWGPPGIGRATINGTPVLSLNQFAAMLQQLLGSPAASAVAGVQHEFCLYGEELDTLRGAFAALEPTLRDIEAAVLDLRRRDQQAQGGLRTGAGQALGQAQSAATHLATSALAAGQRVGAQRPNVGGATAGPDPWEAIRQRVLAFAQTLEPTGRRFAAACDRAKSKKTMVLVVAAIVAIVIAIVVAMVAGTASVLLLVAAVAACVSAVATIVANVPALLAAMGFGAAAAEVAAWMSTNTWFGSILLVVAIFCCLLMILATAPAAGWTWVVERITGSDGAAGLRFGFAR